MSSAASLQQEQPSGGIRDGISVAKSNTLPSVMNTEKHTKWTSNLLSTVLPKMNKNNDLSPLQEEAEKALIPVETLPLKLEQYAKQYSLRMTKEEIELQGEIEKLPRAAMAGAPDEANLLCLMMELMNAKKIIEVGVFRGITTLAFALCLKRLHEKDPQGGVRKVIGLDVSDEYAAVGKKYWREAGVEKYIDLRIDDANRSLDALIHEMEEEKGTESGGGNYDLCFIDADKQSYDDYYEKCLKLTKTGGLICIDNTIWGGQVLTPNSVLDAIVSKGGKEAVWEDAAQMALGTRIIKKLTEKIGNDERIERVSFLTMADGVTICRKK